MTPEPKLLTTLLASYLLATYRLAPTYLTPGYCSFPYIKFRLVTSLHQPQFPQTEILLKLYFEKAIPTHHNKIVCPPKALFNLDKLSFSTFELQIRCKSLELTSQESLKNKPLQKPTVIPTIMLISQCTCFGSIKQRLKVAAHMFHISYNIFIPIKGLGTEKENLCWTVSH